MTQSTFCRRRSVGMIESAMVKLLACRAHPPVRRSRAMPRETLTEEKPVAPEVTSRSPAACSAIVGPAKIRSSRPVAGYASGIGRRAQIGRGDLTHPAQEMARQFQRVIE